VAPQGQQTVHLFLPQSNEESLFFVLLLLTTLLKTVEVLDMVYHQMNVDVFFIDWEKTRGRLVASAGQPGPEMPVRYGHLPPLCLAFAVVSSFLWHPSCHSPLNWTVQYLAHLLCGQ
jgi:hypothetical protein